MASVLRQVQEQVAQQLRESEQLSSCIIYSEDQRDLEFEIKNALGRQGLVLVVTTPRATYMGKLDNTSLAWQLDELEVDVVENVPVNRFKKDNYLTSQEAAMMVFDVLCPLDGGREGQICPVRYEQGQDSGLLVSRCILKCLVTSDEQPGPEPTPQIKKWFVKLLDEAPADGTALQNGWMWQTDDGFVVVKDGVAQALGGVSFDQMSSYVDSATSAFLSTDEISARSSYYAPLRTWKVVEETAVKTYDGNVFMPDGSVFALSSLELDVDGNLSSVQLSAVPQYSVDGKGHYTYIGLAYMTSPQPFYFQTANGTTLELGFNVDGAGTYAVVVGDPEAGVAVAQQPYGEPVTDCNLEFDYGGSSCKVKATNAYAKASDLNTFVREFLGVPDDGSTVPTTLQLMEVSASLENYLPLSGGQVNGALSVGTGVQMFNEADGGVVTISDGSSNQTFYQHNKIGTPNGNLYYPASIPAGDETLATQEYVGGVLSAYPQSNEISATRVQAMTTVHESDWANISASASSSTLYIVIPD